MNYRAIAIEVGDALEYSIGMNDVERAAMSMFGFEKTTYQNHAITSGRAHLVYDWVMTLCERDESDEVRRTLPLSFLKKLTPADLRATVDKILADNGCPDAGLAPAANVELDTRGLHPVVRLHAADLVLQQNYFHAVFEVAKAYNKRVREKSASNLDGEKLMMNAWACAGGVLRLTDCVSETDRNVQDGVKFLSAGLMRAIRNPTAHEPAVEWPIDRADCLDMLSFMSFLFRRLDEASVASD